MTEIYRKDRPTDIVMYRGNYSRLKNIFLLQTQPISSKESSCQISDQSDEKWLSYVILMPIELTGDKRKDRNTDRNTDKRTNIKS